MFMTGMHFVVLQATFMSGLTPLALIEGFYLISRSWTHLTTAVIANIAAGIDRQVERGRGSNAEAADDRMVESVGDTVRRVMLRLVLRRLRSNLQILPRPRQQVLVYVTLARLNVLSLGSYHYRYCWYY